MSNKYDNKHVRLWRKRNASRLEVEERKAAERELAEKRKIGIFRGICKSHGITDMTTNGYVYYFHYDGMAYCVVTQSRRLICTIHRPFVSKEDEKRYHEKECEAAACRNPHSPFNSEYEQEVFIIDGNMPRTLRKLLSGWRPPEQY